MDRSNHEVKFWYLHEGRYLRGPLSRQQASDLYRIGHLTENTYVCQSGWTHWQLAKEVASLRFAHPRMHPTAHGLLGYASIVNADLKSRIRLRDLSMTGAYLNSVTNLPALGALLKGQVHLPDLSQCIDFEGKVVRQGPGSNHSLNVKCGSEVGFAIRFTDPLVEVESLMASKPQLFIT